MKLFCLLLVLWVESTFATSICLYSRSNNDPAGGHAFVVVEENNKVVVSYGFWPESKHPGSIATNKLGDYPFAVLKKKNVIMSEKMLKMIEKRTCQSFDKQNLEELKAKVENYISEYGAYKTLANNCTHFAIRIYNFASGDNFPLVQTPRRVGQIITKMEDAI